MRARTIAGAVATAGIIAGGVLGVTGATAGHTNPLLEAKLKGREEVPTDGKKKNKKNVGDPNGRGEAYVFGIDGDEPRGTLCYVLTVRKIATATGAHIHRGRPGENGPIVANLAAPGDGNAADCLQRDRVLPSGARAFPTAVTAADILANPKGFYINVHNEEYPGGAIRGQLRDER